MLRAPREFSVYVFLTACSSSLPFSPSVFDLHVAEKALTPCRSLLSAVWVCFICMWAVLKNREATQTKSE